jgi:hypothetical protein
MAHGTDCVVQVPFGVGTALTRLIEVADQDPEAEHFVVGLLEVVTQELESWREKAVLPQAEKEAWEAVGASFDPNAMAGARSRRIAAHAELIAHSIQGDAAVADLLGVDRTRISQRLGERSLYSFQSGDERLYPVWQFDNHKTLRGLKIVLGALDPALHPLVVDHWFRTPNVDLEVNEEAMSPLAWLQTGGDPERLVSLVPAT